jgi:hypothetical protein
MNTISMKVRLAAALAAAAVIGYADAGVQYTLMLLAFGLFNALVSPRGTGAVRGATVAVSCLGLIWPGELGGTVVPILFVVWPPAFLIGWSEGQVISADDPGDPILRRRARLAVVAIISAVAIGSLAYTGIKNNGLEQTAALFIGIPAILAIIVVLAVSPKSAVGVACHAVTIGLLVSLLALGEGMVCILMSAPLFYGVAFMIGKTYELVRNQGGRPTAYSLAIVLVFLPMSLEGVSEWASFDRDEWVTETRVVQASSQQVEEALFQPPRFDRVLPAYLRIGFPRPVATEFWPGGTALRWVIRFRGGEMRIDGIEPRVGDLILELVDRRPGLVSWEAINDDSHMTHFLNWREAVVQWTPIDAHSTRVTWRLRYRRGLDPAWYFGPWERYATRLAAGYLIDSVATP